MAEYVVKGAKPNETVLHSRTPNGYEEWNWLPVRERIVRCRDCKYARIMRPLDWRTGKPSTIIEEWYCEWHSNAEGASDIEPDGFCAWGCRKQ